MISVIEIGIIGSSMQHFIGTYIAIQLFTVFATSNKIPDNMDSYGIYLITISITTLVLLLEWCYGMRKRLRKTELFFIGFIFVIGIPFWIENGKVAPEFKTVFHVSSML